MSNPYRHLFVFLLLCLAMVPAFSQQTNTPKTDKKTPVEATKEEPREDGLVKIKTHSSRDWNFDIHIDEEALEANIERAMEHAMRDVEVALDKLDRLEIHINPIEINLGALDLEIDPIEINIPDLDIDIDFEPINIDLDIDHDFDHAVDWDNDEDNDNDEDLEENNNGDKNKDKYKEKDKTKNESKLKDKSEKDEKKATDKSKGLKKINE